MNFTRLFDILPYQNHKYPGQAVLNIRIGNSWRGFSTSEAINKTDACSALLLRMGLQRGDKAAILASGGSPWWNFLDFGMQQIGIVVVPLHASGTSEEMAQILKDAAVRCCFVENDVLFEKIDAVKKEIPRLEYVFGIEKSFGLESLDELLKPAAAKEIEQIRQTSKSIQPADIATIIYTSGTTGRQKGVVLSHHNVVCNIKSILPLVPVDYTKITYSFLPLSHIFERMVTYTCMAAGSPIYYARDVEAALDDLPQIKPNFFSCVPALLERMHDRIIEEAGKHWKPVQKMLFWALQLGKQFRGWHRADWKYLLKRQLADILLYRKWRAALGGRVEGVFVGAAALHPDLCRLFSAAKIEIREGYGLTECAPVVAFNRFEPGGWEFGTVGLPLPGVEVRIQKAPAESEGEILVRGPNVMKGYYRLPEDTAAAIDKDGWLHTGDIGYFYKKRFLKITDRKKDIFKTSSGKYVAPKYVENQLIQSPFIHQAYITGYRRPYVAALIVPNFDMLKTWSAQNNIHWTAPQFMAINPKVEKKLQSEISKVNQLLNQHERIQRFHLLHIPWTAESGILSGTLKTRRHIIEEKYADEIEALYQ